MPNYIVPEVDNINATIFPYETIELAGRVCYKSEDKITAGSAEKFVKKIIKMGHESVLEHASFSFRLICNRGVTHEAVRHRLASFCQESTRYCDYNSNGINIISDEDFLTEEQWNRRKRLYSMIEEIYCLEREEGVAPQIARNVLPIGLKTEIIITANAREWRHIIKLRTSKAAHPQIREVVGKILEWFQLNHPALVEDIS